ncbi:MAG: ribosome silencing factor [Phycisphaerales bacterium]|nr:ribosome silencing factor [Phycisphaerales bacterium]MDP6891427.1 ribosome silencing factor [Phycisphaerales bacterium]
MIDRSGISSHSPEPGSGACTPATRGDSLAFAIEAARTAVDRHCTDVRLFDVRGRSQVCDYVLVASGTSDRQVRSVGAELGDLGESFGRQRFRSNADPASTWVVVDFIDIVMHFFEPSRRAYYDLDELWSDAAEIDFSRGNEA